MQQYNREKLESLRHVLNDRTGTADEVNEILRIVHEEWDHHYILPSSCDPCKMALAEYAFRLMDRDYPKTDTVRVDF